MSAPPYDPKNVSKPQMRNLLRPGMYERGVGHDQASEDFLVDAAYDAYTRNDNDIKAATKAFKRAADGLLIRK